MREIGGYFEMEYFHGQEYYPEAVALNTARQALGYLIRGRKIKKLYVPYYLCSSVFELCAKEACPVEYYSIDEHFLPVLDRIPGKDEWLYVVNYFGQLSQETVLRLKQQYRNVILDNVQAFFQEAAESVDTIYSCRKFFGVPDGAYLATEVRLAKELEQDASRDRMAHLLGRFETTGSAWYGAFREADEQFDRAPLKSMSPVTHNLLRAIDYEAVRQRRNQNYACLSSRLGSVNPLQMNVPDGPFCYPFYCRDGLKTKKRLAEKKIYVPTLWPNVLTERSMDTLEYDYAANILPLPCDQRYGEDDMERICETLTMICRGGVM